MSSSFVLLHSVKEIMMAGKNISANALVVVGTGAGAKFFRNSGGANKIALTLDSQIEAGNMADEGPSGKSPPEQSDKESMEATFSKQLANRLYAMAQRGEFDDLVLILDPGTLGEVRPLLHGEVQSRLRLELAKTLTNSSTSEIIKTLQAA
ncbi:host attachment family protein [Devosia rhodophyticola]|uniref:Host attachment family protein n=1 Tax=Devosia rhodophyticola TaxID=3026423 RepID=A0ABY7YVI8_9HYPH|nr:host attachment family protein [Devosia rhodophyticola]WDR05202.1 host attachment family protein [Devosia rhodophyticola]